MAQKGRTPIKADFETGDIPTEAQYIDLIDSIFNLTDDNSTGILYDSSAETGGNVDADKTNVQTGLKEARDFINTPSSALSTWTPGATVLDKSGAYSSLAVSGNVTIAFSGTPKEGIWQKVRTTGWNSTYTLTVPDLAVIYDNSFTDGGAISTGVYDLWFLYLGGEYIIRLATATIKPAYEAESTALFARMATAGDEPDATRKGHINTLIAGLKTDGEWAEFDAIQVYAAHAESVSKLNWTEDDHNGSLVDVPVFTIDRGYVFDGTDDAIETDFIPLADAVNVGQDDICVWAYVRTAPVGGLSTNLFGANQNSTASVTAIQLTQSPGNNWLTWRVNHHTTFENTPNGDGVFDANSIYALVRTGATAQALNVNGSEVDTSTTASVGLPNVSFYVGANHLESTGLGSSFLDVEVMAWGIGSSSINLTDLKARLDTFLTALGAI